MPIWHGKKRGANFEITICDSKECGVGFEIPIWNLKRPWRPPHAPHFPIPSTGGQECPAAQRAAISIGVIRKSRPFRPPIWSSRFPSPLGWAEELPGRWPSGFQSRPGKFDPRTPSFITNPEELIQINDAAASLICRAEGGSCSRVLTLPRVPVLQGTALQFTDAA